jgi:hypothetical protein
MSIAAEGDFLMLLKLYFIRVWLTVLYILYNYFQVKSIY